MRRITGLVLILAGSSCWRGVDDCYASFDCDDGLQCIEGRCERPASAPAGFSCTPVGQPLKGPPGTAAGQFGFAVSLSATQLLIGDPDATPAGMNKTGAAYVVERAALASSSPNLKQILPPSGTLGDASFGGAVALQGNTAWVGALQFGGAGEGNVFKFDIAAGQLTFQPRTGTSAESFGSALAADDTTVLVAAKASGKVYVPPDTAGLDLSSRVIAVAVSGEWGAVGLNGNVALLKRGASWSIFGNLMPPPGCPYPSSDAVSPVALASTELLVPCQSSFGPQVWRYSLAGNSWSAQAPLPLGSGTGSLGALALGDNLAVVSATGGGPVWALKLEGQKFSAPVPLVVPGAGTRYGATVATAAQWVAVGAPSDGTDQTGRVYVFDCSGN